ncbi:MAG: sulfotransferase family protein [Polyangiales bacterium]
MISAPDLPVGVRALNGALGLLGPLTPLGRKLSADELHERATRQTSLADFGDASYREGFDRLITSINEEARLSPLGKLIAREEIILALTTRLQLEAHHQRHAEIGAAAIVRPIIIIGMGRSGTTILHELLALDPLNRTPATWEVDMPFPPPEASTYDTDPRIEQIQSRLDRTDQIIPNFKKMHRMGATLPQECVRWTAGEFASVIFGTTYDVPSYCNWLIEQADMTPAYRYHRRFLQLLQWKCPAERWVLKSPGHLWSLEAMLAEYPDARLIQTHRDPLKTTASLASLITNLRAMSSKHVDPIAIGRDWANWNAMALEESVRARESGLIRDEQVLDISFYEFMNAPLDRVQSIYDFFDLELKPSVRDRMKDYLAVHSSEQHGAHRYRLSDFGFDLEEERARVRRYQQYFDVPTEAQR